MYAEDRFFNVGERPESPQMYSGIGLRVAATLCSFFNGSLLLVAGTAAFLAGSLLAALVYWVVGMLFVVFFADKMFKFLFHDFEGPA